DAGITVTDFGVSSSGAVNLFERGAASCARPSTITVSMFVSRSEPVSDCDCDCACATVVEQSARPIAAAKPLWFESLLSFFIVRSWLGSENRNDNDSHFSRQ